MTSATADYHSKQEIIDLPADGKRYEVVWGELLVTTKVSLAHQHALMELFMPIVGYCERNQLGEVYFGPADISWGPDTLVKPDLFVAPTEEVRASEDWSSVRTLRLVVEVLSEETARADRFPKRRLYQSQRVDPVWLVDHDRALVEVWTPDDLFPVIETERIIWHPAGAPEPLVIPLATLFHTR
jgi:Uma2 family endonuclease